ncbi:MAG: hypothetical protein JST20_13120 [Bacteroidetes bacterium]|nr:hypothetical protein [Bacteroidota bacterium]
MSKKSQKKVLEAQWLYDNIKPMTVQIYKFNYDFFYDLDEGYNEGQVKELDENGEQYAVYNNCPVFNKMVYPFHISLDLEEAKKYVEKTIKQKLSWV